ncbi:MAG TPA: hypothetical protein VGN47_11505 [Blastococcus sp.]|jgi:hypothetical protein|nr:hypothetical protein [Blastococcus sp.]
MNISTVSHAHLAAAQNPQTVSRAAATKAATSQPVAATDSDGDHDGSTGGRIDVRA